MSESAAYQGILVQAKGGLAEGFRCPFQPQHLVSTGGKRRGRVFVSLCPGLKAQRGWGNTGLCIVAPFVQHTAETNTCSVRPPDAGDNGGDREGLSG